jgi:hypothetical protein
MKKAYHSFRVQSWQLDTRFLTRAQITRRKRQRNLLAGKFCCGLVNLIYQETSKTLPQLLGGVGYYSYQKMDILYQKMDIANKKRPVTAAPTPAVGIGAECSQRPA